MSLIDAVEAVCGRLVTDNGWHTLFLRHGLDIKARPLAAELSKTLSVDRTLKGFEDFSLSGQRGIEAGKPALSLLFHALASPNVLTDPNGNALSQFPTAAEIYAVLQYVYGLRAPTLADLQQQAGPGALLGIVVFAAEYRTGPDTFHKKHADMCFSRTGIARVGNSPECYYPKLRGFLPWVKDDPQAICVTPARYYAYIAMQKTGDESVFGPRPFQPGDDTRNFWVPLQLLFDGPECIAGKDLKVTLELYQISEKLAQFHSRVPEAGWATPDILNPPFVITDGLADWADPNKYGPGLAMPVPRPQLIEKAVYQGKDLTFFVPPKSDLHGYIINRRYKELADGSFEDLNLLADVGKIEDAGNYRALHFLDGTAEGHVGATCPQLQTEVVGNAKAYALTAAPDSYPQQTQRRLQEWTDQQHLPPQFYGSSLKVLADIRSPANPHLSGGDFQPEDSGITALVSHPRDPAEPGTNSVVECARPQVMLTDGATGQMSPGWDVSGFGGGGPRPAYLTVSELGSPYTNDWKKCSEIGGYWAAVSADTSRNYEPAAGRIPIIPLTDEEAGQSVQKAWDGVPGPRIVDLGGGKRVAEYTSNEHVDYTKNALAGLLMMHPLAQTTAEDYQERILSMHHAFVSLGASSRQEKAKWSVLSFRKVVRPDADLEQAEAATGKPLAEPVHGYRIYDNDNLKPTTPDHDFTLRHAEILEMVDLFVSPEWILMRREQGAWEAHDIASL